MNRNLLEPLVNAGLSSMKIAEKLGCSQTTAYRWIRYYGFLTQKIPKCRLCGEIDISKFSKGRFTECRKCRVKMQIDRYRKYKKELVEYKGGKCELCGYNKCYASLDFHHKNPEEKDPDWRKMRSWTPSRVKKEIDKCQLICKNCHSEIHYLHNDLQDVV